MVIGDNNGSCTRNLYFALRANGEAYPILPEMKQQLWTLPLVREGKTTDMWYVIQVQAAETGWQIDESSAGRELSFFVPFRG